MKKFLFSLFIILALVACNENFLEKEPLDKLSEGAVFTNAGLMEQYVNALYNVVPHPFSEGTMAACTDEAFFRFGGNSCNRVARGQLTGDNVVLGDFHSSRLIYLVLWERVFSYVRNMNIFLERVDGAPVDGAVKNRLKGEVYFLRAWTYFHMLSRYGGIPIIKNAFQLGDDYSGVVRDKYDDCLNFIMDDLNAAIALLDSKAATQGRVDGATCRALKARAYLYAASPLFNDPNDPQGSIFKGAYSKDKWKYARDAAKDFMDNHPGYALGATYDDYWANTNSVEVIWARYFDATTAHTSAYGAQLYYSPAEDGLGGWKSCTPMEQMVVDYEMAATGLKPFEDGSGYNAAQPWAGRDPRFYKSILYPEMKYQGKTIQICSPSPDNTFLKSNDKWYAGSQGTDGTGYWLRKWLIDNGDDQIDENEKASESINTTLMYPWFRLAEIYLIYAEASLEYSDDIATCTEYINKIRDRADVKMPHVSPATVAEAREKLIQERRIELAFEDHRYFDLRRWKLSPVYDIRPAYGITGVRHDNKTQDGSDDYITWGIAQKGANGQPDFSKCRMIDNTRTFVDKMYLLPIPRPEIIKTEGRIVQNPNY